ncbi:MAG: prepilin-type N-terminal cleavage/methylation domain-containing protein [Nitrososphaeria archaeon]
MSKLNYANRYQKNRYQRGMTLIEILIALAITIAFTVAVLVVYNGNIKPNMYVNDKVQAFTTLTTGLDNSKELNGGAYPAASSAVTLPITNPSTPQQNLIYQASGGDNPNYSGWQYTCNNGTLTIGVNVSDTASTTLQQNVETAIASDNSDFTCTAVSNGMFTCSKSNVVCK